MSSETSFTPQRLRVRRLLRWWPVLAILAIAVGVVIVRFATVNHDPYKINWALITGLVLSWVILVFWLLTATLPRAVRWTGLSLLILPAAAFAAYFRVESPEYSGGMWPRFYSRFEANPEEILHQHLQGTTNRIVPDAVDLSGRKPTDWAEYRGRNRDGIVLGPQLMRDWSAKQPRMLWKHPIGGGHSSFTVADKALFTLEQRGGDEAITCYDAHTGLQYWAFTYPAFFKESMGGIGPRSTPTVIDGEVFALGATGMLTCLDARTGKAKWGPVNVLAGNANVMWAMSGSPLVVDDVVLVNAGVQSASAPHGTVIAFDRKTGNVLWSTSSRAHAGYSSPMLATLAGKRQLLLFDGDGLAGYELDDPKSKGKQLWRYPWKTTANINVAQPLVLEGDRLFVTSGYEVGSALLQIKRSDDTWAVEPLWKPANKNTLQCKFSSPVYYKGHVYGHNNYTLVCVDAATGETQGEGREYGFGQVLLCNDLLVVTGEEGQLAIVGANPELRELARVQALKGRSWNPAAVANGRIYWRNAVEMVCYDLSRN